MKDQEFVKVVNEKLHKKFPNIQILAVEGNKWSFSVPSKMKGGNAEFYKRRFVKLSRFLKISGIKEVSHLFDERSGSYLGIETTDGRKFTAYFDCGVIYEQDWDGEYPDDIPECVFKVRDLFIGEYESEVE
jgi:hypothetical protein